MQENIKKYHPLGKKTLFMLIFKRSLVMILLMPILIISLISLSYIPSDYVAIAAYIVSGYFVVLLIILGLAFFIGWLEYFRYWIFIDDKDLKVARGLIATEQIGIPYRHVQDIKIKRSLIDQLFGVSDIIITVLGSDKDQSFEEESTIVLPSLEKDIALEIQNIVLRKAQVEQVNVLGGQRIN